MIVFCSMLLSLCLGLTSCGAYGSKNGIAEEKTSTAETLTDKTQATGQTHPLLMSDRKYTYIFDEKGQCVSASENGQEKFTFTYDYDAAGHPKTRYMTESGTGKKSKIETYSYGGNGAIEKRTEFTDNGETDYRYNEKGQLVYCSDLAMLNAQTSFGNTAIEYDGNGHVSRLVSTWYSTPEEAVKSCLGNKGTAEEIRQKTTELSKLFPNPSDYVRQTTEWQYEYDTEGRAVKIIYKEDHSKLDNYCTTGDASKETKTVEEYGYDYSGDGTQITLSRNVCHYVNGTETKSSPDSGSFSFQVSYQNNLATVVNGQTIDFYDSLGITPEQAAVGYFGLDGCDTASHYWGEVYSGIIGMQFDRKQQQKTGSLFLRIDGNNSTGEKIQILLGCDSFGRSLDCILHGGKLAAPQTAEVNLNMKNRYHFENYEEWYVYQNNG